MKPFVDSCSMHDQNSAQQLHKCEVQRREMPGLSCRGIQLPMFFLDTRITFRCVFQET